MIRVIKVTADRPGETVTVEAGPRATAIIDGKTVRSGRVTLEMAEPTRVDGAWTWLTFTEARQIAEALREAADVAEREVEPVGAEE